VNFKIAEDGEILVRGESVSSGYWQQGALRPTEQQSWLRTGRPGELDAEGNVRFRGRKKNVIVTPAGLNVYPEEPRSCPSQTARRQGLRGHSVERSGNAEPCGVL